MSANTKVKISMAEWLRLCEEYDELPEDIRMKLTFDEWLAGQGV